VRSGKAFTATIVLPARSAKILIIKPSSLGDIIHSLPFLDAVKRRYPKAEIHWIVAKGFEDILEGHPLVHRIWVINKDAWKKIAKVATSALELRSLFKELRSEKFDCAVDLQGLFRSGFITWASSAPIRIGFDDAREGSKVFYTHMVIGGRARDIHAVDRYLGVAALLGCDISRVRFPLPPGKGSRTETSAAKFIPSQYAVMVPGARGPSKRWSALKFGELASMLPVKTVVIGSKADAVLADKVVQASKGRAVSLAGRTGLKDMVEIIRGAKFMVCNDTGPMHIAAALGIHVFGLFGPTSAARTGPYGNANSIVRATIPCAPCFRKRCKTVACMDVIEVRTVKDSIDKFLALR